MDIDEKKEKKKLVILAGPTAVGKTCLSLSLAKKIGGEIISADSMQVYKHMDIGSAKIKEEERQGVPHFLIDEWEPDEEVNVVVFQRKAKEYIDEISHRGHIPILTGGTGFYIQAVLYDIDFTENKDQQGIRQRLEKEAKEKGSEWLFEQLKKVDEKSCRLIHANNVKRVIRALEYYALTGEPISEHNETQKKRESPYEFTYFVLNDDRQRLYAGIERRVEKMMDEGLVEEVEKLRRMGCDRSFVSMQGIGYKEILSYLEGELSLDEAIDRIKLNTRHFAKRQLTWFKKERQVIWLNKPDFGYDEKKILSYMTGRIKAGEG